MDKAGDVRSLIKALAESDPVGREAAIARLAIIGARAVERLLATYPGADRDTRIAILRALEPVGDPRSLQIAVGALREGGDLAVTAAAVLHGLIESAHESASAAALDALVGTALDASAERHVRLAALRELPDDVRERVGAAMQPERDGRRTDSKASPELDAADALWQDVTEGRLPEAPAALRDAVGLKASATPLSNLRRMIEAVRAREMATASPRRRADWRELRGSLHHALALRRSRVALDDLCDSIAVATEPLPVSFLSAIHAIGNASALEALAAAYDRAPDTQSAWRDQIASAFQGIVRRERITKTHAAMKRVAAKWPESSVRLREPGLSG